jgi:ferric-dicitrate binding protein FerR (iron transport regulator)
VSRRDADTPDEAVPATPPPRLAEQPADEGALLRAAGRAYARGLDEGASWERFAAATLGGRRPPGRPRRTMRLVLPLALVAAAAAAALVVAGRLGPRRPTELAARAPVAPAAPALPAVVPLARTTAPDVPAEEPPAVAEAPPHRVTPTRHPRALAIGATLLADGTSIRLAPRAVAAVRTAARADRAVTTTVALASGAIELEVARQDARHDFQVEGGRYRFQVAGARFRLVRSDARAELEVREGTVAVLANDRVVARVGRGHRWASPLLASSDRGAVGAARADAGATAVEATTGVAHEPGNDDCLALARDGRTRPAIECYDRVAQGNGSSAEQALLELARLRQNVLGDVAGAVAALEQHRARFPRGVLKPEAELSLVELLPKLGRHAEALTESERLLATAAGRERATELRFLRGNIYREILRDYGDAEAEYASAARDRGATGDEAAFLRGVCLEAEGKKDAAADAFRGYLQRAGARKSVEAQRHLDALAR